MHLKAREPLPGTIDPALKIDWRIPTEKVILSEKDKHHPLLADAEWLFDYHEDLYKE